jgi:DNA-3-methyladenine glycosylase
MRPMLRRSGQNSICFCLSLRRPQSRGVPRILRASELAGTDTVAIARCLLGRLLVTRVGGRRVARRITEVEAYDGPHDRASHASRGRTRRNEPMFAAGGIWYVYLCYGVHEMLNLVTGPHDYPAAVLIRGVEGAVGPGRVTRALGVDRRFNALPATRATGLWIEDDGFTPAPARLMSTPRVGVDYAGPEWSAKPWRFVLATPAKTEGTRRLSRRMVSSGGELAR